MPAGVAVVVDGDGFATIDFVDPATRGPGLAALNATGCAEFIEKDTRSGPRVLYRAPEGNVREAGLLDETSQVEALEKPDTSSATDASGATPPEPPSATELYAQTVRTGSYAAEGTPADVLVESPTEVVPVETPAPDPTPAAPLIESPAEAGDPAPSKGYDDGLPDGDWSRAALNTYAAEHGIANPGDLPNKAAVLAAIRAQTKDN